MLFRMVVYFATQSYMLFMGAYMPDKHVDVIHADTDM